MQAPVGVICISCGMLNDGARMLLQLAVLADDVLAPGSLTMDSKVVPSSIKTVRGPIGSPPPQVIARTLVPGG